MFVAKNTSPLHATICGKGTLNPLDREIYLFTFFEHDSSLLSFVLKATNKLMRLYTTFGVKKAILLKCGTTKF